MTATTAHEPAGATERVCRRCGASKPIDAFRLTPRMRSGRLSWCLACERERTRQWRIEHKDAINAGRRLAYARSKGATPCH